MLKTYLIIILCIVVVILSLNLYKEKAINTKLANLCNQYEKLRVIDEQLLKDNETIVECQSKVIDRIIRLLTDNQLKEIQ